MAFRHLYFGQYCNVFEIIFVLLNTLFIVWGMIITRLGVEQFAGLIRVLSVLTMLCKLKQM